MWWGGGGRTEVVLLGTANHTVGEEAAMVWEEYDFKCKPGQSALTPSSQPASQPVGVG